MVKKKILKIVKEKQLIKRIGQQWFKWLQTSHRKPWRPQDRTILLKRWKKTPKFYIWLKDPTWMKAMKWRCAQIMENEENRLPPHQQYKKYQRKFFRLKWNDAQRKPGCSWMKTFETVTIWVNKEKLILLNTEFKFLKIHMIV